MAGSSANITAAKDQIICFVNNTEATTFFSTVDVNTLHINHKLISEEIYFQNYENYTKTVGEVASCDAVIKLTSAQHIIKYACPELCMPKPYTELPLSLLLPTTQQQALLNVNVTVTCSMTVAGLIADGAAPHHHHKHVHASQNHTTPATSSSTTPSHHAHMSTSIILKSVLRRRVEECSERYHWPHGAAVSGTSESNNAPLRRKIHGLVIWTGSRSRYSLVASQIEVLRNQSLSADSTPDNVIVGWMATEDVYPCRVGSTLCESATSSNNYYHYMPSTRLNFASAGWGCAQRRPLRSLAHTLLLFDPNYLLLVDDDTYVSVKVLQKMDPYIRKHLMTEALVMGQLTKGRKITKMGFYYGGAGYMIGKLIIDRLTAYQIEGPAEASNKMLDPTQTKDLSVFNQAADLTAAICPECMVMHPGSAKDGLNTKANTTVRMIELCVNIMAQEHTCYHSDHSISRCLIHGSNAYPLSIECGGSSMDGVDVGMCMGLENCDTNVHLTCHRWEPTKKNNAIPRNQYGPLEVL